MEVMVTYGCVVSSTAVPLFVLMDSMNGSVVESRLVGNS